MGTYYNESDRSCLCGFNGHQSDRANIPVDQLSLDPRFHGAVNTSIGLSTNKSPFLPRSIMPLTLHATWVAPLDFVGTMFLGTLNRNGHS